MARGTNACWRQSFGYPDTCCYLAGNGDVSCFKETINAVTLAFKVDISTANGVNFKDNTSNALDVEQTLRSAGCGPLSWSRQWDRPERPTQLRWYVGGGKQCNIETSVTFAVEYQPGMVFGTNNASTTPELTSLSWKGRDIAKVTKLASALIHVCTGSPITTCTVTLPIKASFKFAINLREMFIVDGYAFLLEIGTNLRRYVARALGVTSYVCSTSTSSCACEIDCRYGVDECPALHL